MRIVLVSETFTESMGYTENLLPRYLAKLGHDVHVVSSDLQASYYYGNDLYGPAIPPVVQPGVFPVDNFTLHRLPHRLVGGYPWLIGLIRRVHDLKPDIIQAQGSASLFSLESAAAAIVTGARLFTAAHQHASVMGAVLTSSRFSLVRLRSSLRRALPGRMVSAVAETCYATTVDCAEVAVNYYGVPSSKVTIAPLGCDTDTFWPVADEAAHRDRMKLRGELGFARDDIVCVYSGRFSPAKNPACLARALQLLQARGKPFRGLFIGGGPQMREIEETPGCRVHPFVPTAELAPMYRAADIGVWPCEDSMSMIDAGACGLPLVVSDRMRATERIRGNGFSYRQGDPVALSRVLERLEARQIRETMGQVGATRIAESYSWNRIAADRVDDYRFSLARLARNV